jgi:hypothetical protein
VLNTGLEIERNDKLVLVQITEQGRDQVQKAALFARSAELEQRGVASEGRGRFDRRER